METTGQIAGAAVDREEVLRRAEIDASCRLPVMAFLTSSVAWLLVGSGLALLASWKLHSPEFLANWPWLTFGRVRPAHLTVMAYGWASMAGIGALLWLEARLCRVTLPLQGLLLGGGALWNVAVAGGTLEILAGRGTSVEWLEIPPFWAGMLAVVFLLVTLVSMMMFAARRVSHIYVSQWYLFGAVLWFPFLYVMANWLIHFSVVRGVTQAATNWWFAHNVLGLWLTPIGLASVYYLLPKILGVPIYSYHLSLLGFWTLALFYNWAGTHHLIGGPLPAWLVTVGVVGSVMMLIPVATVALNHHMTTKGHFARLKDSPTLRFTVFGAMSYTAVSVQGSLTALRSVNEVVHFTHYTVAHAHLGVYAFYSMVIWAVMYYAVPRLTGKEWPSVRLIAVHFWCAAVGMAIYWVGLTWAGVWQGVMMNDPDVAFLEVVRYTVPYLWSRSVAGVLMTTGHVVFAWHVLRLLLPSEGRGRGPALFGRRRALEVSS